MGDRGFRFGVQVASAASAGAWAEIGRKAEGLGFDVLVVPDHVADGLLSPMVALQAVADATTALRVGTLVLNNDFRNPALLGREAATLDLLSDGRLELGIGAGHAEPEYAELGIRFDPAPVRVGRLTDSVRVLRDHFRGPLLVGGNGDRVLALAATAADIVGFTGLARTLPDGQRHTVEWAPPQIDAKMQVVRKAAGSRIDELELNALVQHIEITTHRRSVIDGVAAAVAADPAVVSETPYVLAGTVHQITDQLHAARARWGFTYFVTRDADATAPVIEALR